MRKFEAPTLEEAYAEAAKAFSCSITELDIQVVQNPSRGFLGFGKKPAVIVATCPAQERNARKGPKRDEPQKEAAAPAREESAPMEKPSPEQALSGEVPQDRSIGSESGESEMSEEDEITALVREVIAEAPARRSEGEDAESAEKTSAPPRLQERADDIFDNFYSETPDIHSVVPEIAEKIERLFEHACFDLDGVEVSVYDEETVLVEFNGSDAALLIGKEGYRYKALASLLYNWIHGTYGFRVRLEIAEFLRNQETMIENYLGPVIERAEKEGRAQTKVLDGILVQIALKRLRERFPDKYVAVRTNREGGRFIIINEFLEKR
jgi:spoIIIJ-associated protein